MRRVASVLALAASIGGGSAIAQEAPKAPAAAPAAKAGSKRVPVSLDLDAADRQRATELAGLVRGADFAGPYTDRDPRNAKLFVWLAATHADDKVVAAALQAMGRTFVAKAGKSERPVVDADYRALVKAYLGQKAAPLLGGALVAGRLLISTDPPDEATLATVMQIARDHELPQARLVAIRQLNSVKDFQLPEPRPGKVKQRVVEALLDAGADAVDYVAAGALMRLASAAYPAMPHRDALLALAHKQAAHADAAVRGRAVQLAARLAKSPEEKAAAGKLAEEKLSDADPFVRSMAAEAVGELGLKSALPKLVTLVDDTKSNVYDRDGVKALTGEPLNISHDGSPGRRVDDAALRALQRLTRGLGAKAFKPKPVRANALAEDLPRAAGEAKAWFAKHGASVKGK